MPPGDRNVLIFIFSFALLLSFSDARNLSPDERGNAPMASGYKQGRKTHALISNMVWFVADLDGLNRGRSRCDYRRLHWVLRCWPIRCRHRSTCGRNPSPMKSEDVIAAKGRPFTGAEYLASLRDGRDVYIYG